MLATFFEITPDDITAIIGHTKELIGDLTPFLTLIIAVGIGLIIFSVIVKTIRGE